ncbi:MAG: four helix bundle protein [Pseudomonadota bacterium]
MKDFRELDVLHAAHDLVVEVHDISQSFPDKDPFGIVNAISGAALAIPRNIVDGCGRGDDDDIKGGLRLASGAASELEYLMLLAGEVGFVDDETLEEFSVTLGEFRSRMADELKAR